MAAATAEPAHPGLDHTQRQRGGDGGIDRVAAAAEHLGADRCSKMMLSRHDAAARAHHALAHLPGVRAQLADSPAGHFPRKALARGGRHHQLELLVAPSRGAGEDGVKRISGLLLAFGLVGGCVSDGRFADGVPASSGIRWSGPYGSDPYSPGSRCSVATRMGATATAGGNGGRTFSPSRGVVCDRATETCYRGREIDASETRDYFGKSASRQVDRIRDQAGTNRIYRVDDDVVCNRRTKSATRTAVPTAARHATISARRRHDESIEADFPTVLRSSAT